MCARHRSRPDRSSQAAAPRRAGAIAPRWLALAALLGFAGGAIGWWVNRPAPPPAAPGAPDPAAGLDLAGANAAAIRLVGEGRHVESLPYFRRQLELLDAPVWAAHKDYASALHNAAAESGTHGPATRSSLERIALLAESLRQLDLAAALTDRPGERAALLADGAHTFEFWGMPWDALDRLHRAAALPGAAPAIARRAAATRAALEHPLADPGTRPEGRS